MKKCNYCGDEKPLSHFHKQKGTKDGTRGHCRYCAALKMRNFRKHGSTISNIFEDKTIDQLLSIRRLITVELKKRGAE